MFYCIDDLIDKEAIEDLICPICLQILRNPVCCSDKINSHCFCKDCIDEFLKEKNNCPVCKLIFEYKNNKNVEDLICPICLNILINPINCSDKKNSHSFCKKCINKYLKEKNKCPICKNFFEYKINKEINNLLYNLSFNCLFKNEGCNYIISYVRYFKHINNCKYNNMKYECQIKKYNYKNKKFEICGYLANENKIMNHYKLCGNIEYKCIFCNETILQINL